MTIFVTWQLRVKLDSIRNSCDVFPIVTSKRLVVRSVSKVSEQLFYHREHIKGENLFLKAHLSEITARENVESATNVYSICFFTCKARWSERAKVRSHILQAYGLTPVCFLMCLPSSSDLENFQPQPFQVQI